MSTALQDAPAQSYGLSLAAALRPVGVHVTTGSRWILRGKKLSDGSTLRLKAVRTPGGWRVKPEDVDAFLAAITRDHLGDVAPATPIETEPARARRLAAVDRELAAAGLL